jgi:hypothetical protein
MRSTLSNACISALLCSAALFVIPAVAAAAGGTPSSAIGAGASTSAAGTDTGAVTPSTGVMNNNSATNANPAVPSNTVPRTADGRTTITGGAGDSNTATIGNNAGSVDATVQTPSHRIAKKSQANANAAKVENTRQLNQQQATGANGAVGATIQ